MAAMANESVAKFANNIGEIIYEFTDDEVMSLATTITGGLLKNKINSRQDSLKVILNYSEDVPSLLRRKVFTRDKLLSYLHEKNVSIKLPVTKSEIIEKILQLWMNETTISHSDDDSEISRQTELDDFRVGSNQSTQDEIAANSSEHQQLVASTCNDSGSEIIEKHETSNDTNVQNIVKVLAEQFSDWFYKLFNKNELLPENFFPDAVLNLALTLNGHTNTTNVCNDPAAVTKTLIEIKNQYNLYFNPNLMKDSLNAQMDSHGLVIIIIAGTLHINSVCVGVFEQMFALARDPFAENNWKIKRTDLRLKNGAISDGPSRLCNTDNVNSDAYSNQIAK